MPSPFVIFSSISILSVWGFSLHVCLCTTHMPGATEARRGYLNPGTTAEDECDLLCWCCESNPGPLEGQIFFFKCVVSPSITLYLIPLIQGPSLSLELGQ